MIVDAGNGLLNAIYLSLPIYSRKKRAYHCASLISLILLWIYLKYYTHQDNLFQRNYLKYTKIFATFNRKDLETNPKKEKIVKLLYWNYLSTKICKHIRKAYTHYLLAY